MHALTTKTVSACRRLLSVTEILRGSLSDPDMEQIERLLMERQACMAEVEASHAAIRQWAQRHPMETRRAQPILQDAQDEARDLLARTLRLDREIRELMAERQNVLQTRISILSGRTHRFQGYGKQMHASRLMSIQT